MPPSCEAGAQAPVAEAGSPLWPVTDGHLFVVAFSFLSSSFPDLSYWACPVSTSGSEFATTAPSLLPVPCCFRSCQQLLPATGVPVSRHQFDHMRDMFDEYVKSRTLQNWKFWIVSLCFLCFSSHPHRQCLLTL